jgi:capsid protein
MSRRQSRAARRIRAIAEKTGIAESTLVANNVVAKKSPSNRTVSSDAVRSQLFGFGISTQFKAASGNPHIPIVPQATPTGLVYANPKLRSLSRYLVDNNTWTSALVDRLGERVVGTGPVPKHEDRRLNDLWNKFCDRFDDREIYPFGDWLRNDIYRTYNVDGESFARAKFLSVIGFDPVRSAPVFQDGEEFPLKFQSMTAEFVPEWYALIGLDYNGQPARSVTGIIYSNVRPGKRLAYWCYDQFPYDEHSIIPQNFMAEQVDASLITHYFDPPMVGSPRGRIKLGTILIRALNLDDYEDAEQKRKKLNLALSAFIKETTDTSGEGRLPGEEDYDVNELISQVSLAPCGVTKLPAGMDIEIHDPKPTPSTDDWYTKFQIMAFAACFGIPVYEVTQDYTSVQSDRTAKFATVNFKAKIDMERNSLERRVLDFLWKHFVTTVYMLGLWRPADGREVSDYFRSSWTWPQIQTATLKSDVDAYVDMINNNIVDRDTASRALVSMEGEDVSRRVARVEARDRVLGLKTDPVKPVPNGDGTPGTPDPLPDWNAESSDVTRGIMADAEAREAAAYAADSEGSAEPKEAIVEA